MAQKLKITTHQANKIKAMKKQLLLAGLSLVISTATFAQKKKVLPQLKDLPHIARFILNYE
jgi:uncharacterized membrane protein